VPVAARKEKLSRQRPVRCGLLALANLPLAILFQRAAAGILACVCFAWSRQVCSCCGDRRHCVDR